MEYVFYAYFSHGFQVSISYAQLCKCLLSATTTEVAEKLQQRLHMYPVYRVQYYGVWVIKTNESEVSKRDLC